MTKSNKEIFSDNLSYLMRQRGIDRNTLCTDLNLKYTTVRDWVKGITYPRIGKIELLANYFGVNKSDLIEQKSSYTNPQPDLIPSTLQKITSTSSQLEHKRQLNVLDYAETQLEQQNTVTDLFSYNYYDQALSAGTGQYLNEVNVETIELPVNIDADFVVPVYGDSMEPEYYSGDYVFVKLSVELSDGDIGVFELCGDAYIKQLLINAEGAFLHSLNSKYEDIPIDKDSDFRIIGEIIGKYRK